MAGAAVENEQKMEFDVKIDNTAPKIAKPKVEGNIYKPEITDNLSGVEETVLRYIDKNGETKWITVKEDRSIRSHRSNSNRSNNHNNGRRSNSSNDSSHTYLWYRKEPHFRHRFCLFCESRCPLPLLFYL